MKKITVSLLFAAFIHANCFASTVVVLWTPSAAMIGADAKQRKGEVVSATCKIGEVSDNILWAQAGIRSADDTSTGGTVFDFRSLLVKQLGSGVSLESRIAQVEAKIKQALSFVLNAPSMRAGALAKPNVYGVQVAIISRERDMIHLWSSEFFPTKGAAGNIEVSITRRQCPGKPDCGNSQSLLFGYHEEADVETRRNPGIWTMTGGPQAIIRRLIGLEIAAKPDEVGPPITIAQIDRTGVHWIDKGACH